MRSIVDQSLQVRRECRGISLFVQHHSATGRLRSLLLAGCFARNHGQTTLQILEELVRDSEVTAWRLGTLPGEPDIVFRDAREEFSVIHQRVKVHLGPHLRCNQSVEPDFVAANITAEMNFKVAAKKSGRIEKFFEAAKVDGHVRRRPQREMAQREDLGQPREGARLEPVQSQRLEPLEAVTRQPPGKRRRRLKPPRRESGDAPLLRSKRSLNCPHARPRATLRRAPTPRRRPRPAPPPLTPPPPSR